MKKCLNLLFCTVLLVSFGCAHSDKSGKCERSGKEKCTRKDGKECKDGKKCKRSDCKKCDRKENESANKTTSEKDKAPASVSSAATGATKVTCSNGGDTRILEIVNRDQGGCSLMYTKMGETQELASAQNDISHCERVSSRVQSNLSNAGYTCN